MSAMRTTLTLDPDVADRLKEMAKLSDKPFKTVVNDLLRRGLAVEAGRKPKRKRFVVRPHRAAFRPEVDPMKLNQLADDLEADAFLARIDDRP